MRHHDLRRLRYLDWRGNHREPEPGAQKWRSSRPRAEAQANVRTPVHATLYNLLSLHSVINYQCINLANRRMDGVDDVDDVEFMMGGEGGVKKPKRKEMKVGTTASGIQSSSRKRRR